MSNRKSGPNTGRNKDGTFGLGNPGKKYLETRHNAGWHLLDTIVRDNTGFRFDEKRNKAILARGELAVNVPCGGNQPMPDNDEENGYCPQKIDVSISLGRGL